MFLTWDNITVTTNQSTVTRGIEITLGTPPQVLSLRPSTVDPSMFVASLAQCAPSYAASCASSHGGLFDHSSSTTFVQTTQAAWNGSDSNDVDNGISEVFFNDVFQFGNASISGFPVTFDQIGYGQQGTLPLSTTSDWLKLGVANNAIPSTVYGIWPGSMSPHNPMQGSLVLGGYDTTRFKGELTTFPSEDGCETCVVITALTYNDANGSISLFANSSEALQVTLQPAITYLTLPQDIWAKWRDATNGTYNPSEGQLVYPFDNVPTGNITVTLSNGYETTIPNSELFNAPRGYNDQGKFTYTNATYQVGQIYNATLDGYIGDWGMPYMTMNYLIADFKRGQFHMAPAIRSTYEAQGGGYVLKASCDPVPTATPPPPPPPVSSSSSVSSSTTTASPVSGNGHNHTRAIAGGVIGGAAGVVGVIGGLILFCRHRHRSHRTAATEETSVPGTHQAHTTEDEISPLGIPEVHGSGIYQDKATELHSTHMLELPSPTNQAELDASSGEAKGFSNQEAYVRFLLPSRQAPFPVHIQKDQLLTHTYMS